MKENYIVRLLELYDFLAEQSKATSDNNNNNNNNNNNTTTTNTNNDPDNNNNTNSAVNIAQIDNYLHLIFHIFKSLGK